MFFREGKSITFLKRMKVKGAINQCVAQGCILMQEEDGKAINKYKETCFFFLIYKISCDINFKFIILF
jgi:hypothetical protein